MLQLTYYKTLTIINIHYNYIIQNSNIQIYNIQKNKIILYYYYLYKLHLKNF